MSSKLQISSGNYTSKGVKEENQDFHGIMLPGEPALSTKGAAAVIADGMSASYAGREASETCGKSFLLDYFSTPESWSVKKSCQQVLTSLNNWLYSKGQANPNERFGLVTTFSAAIFKSNTAHIFHVGDSRIYRLRNNEFEQLTRDHRIWTSKENSYLNRAMGIDIHLDIDYKSIQIEPGDTFIFTTDGIHDYVSEHVISDTIRNNLDDLERAATLLGELSLNEYSSQDNITCQVIRIDSLPVKDANEVYQQLTKLPFPPDLEQGNIIDGYTVKRAVHASTRSQCYLAVDNNTGEQVLLKTPSVNYEDDETYIESFILEEWVGKRISNPHVLKTHEQHSQRHFLYQLTEFVEGQTLRSWMNDHPHPDLPTVRSIVDQVSKGLRAFHRLEMIHRDLKPENIMIEKHGMIKIIDFGSTKIPGLDEIASPVEHNNLVGTADYTAPEYMDGETGSSRSDLYSLAVITYEMLTGRLPFNKPLIERSISRREYIPAKKFNPAVPVWVDGALRKATHNDPDKRHEKLSEFLYDLSHPNPEFTREKFQPLLERNPVSFWRWSAIIMLLCNLVLLAMLSK